MRNFIAAFAASLFSCLLISLSIGSVSGSATLGLIIGSVGGGLIGAGVMIGLNRGN